MKKHPFRVFIEVWFFFLMFVILELPIMGLLVRAQPLLGLPWDAIFHVLIFFFITLFIHRKFTSSFKAYNIFMAIILAVMIYETFNILVIQKGRIDLLAIPNYLCIILGYLGGLVYVKNRKTLGLSLGTLGLVIGILYVTQFKYFGQYYSYRNITGTVKEPISVNDLLLTDATGNNLVLDPDVYYVMDFWHTRCASCFRSMPKINNWHELNKNPKVQYLLVNKPLAHFDTLGQAFAIIKEKGMSIPNYVGTEDIDSLMGVPEFPTIVVVKNKEIIFRGRNDIFSERRLAQLMK